MNEQLFGHFLVGIFLIGESCLDSNPESHREKESYYQ
jgi:hypothetical protein